jgi:hypothetical protein
MPAWTIQWDLVSDFQSATDSLRLSWEFGDSKFRSPWAYSRELYSYCICQGREQVLGGLCPLLDRSCKCALSTSETFSTAGDKSRFHPKCHRWMSPWGLLCLEHTLGCSCSKNFSSSECLSPVEQLHFNWLSHLGPRVRLRSPETGWNESSAGVPSHTLPTHLSCDTELIIRLPYLGLVEWPKW